MAETDGDQAPPQERPRGRPRSDASRRRILAAAAELLEAGGWSALSVEGIAARAGVGKQTIYRWYGGDIGRIVVEATVGVGQERASTPDTGTVRGDLLALLVPVASLNADRDAGIGLANRSLMAHAQVSRDFAATYATLHEHRRGPLADVVRRGVARGELVPETDPDTVVDLLLGLQWYRLLIGHIPVGEASTVAAVDALLDGLAPRRT